MKKHKHPEEPHYKDIVMPNNSAASVFIGGFSLLFGFGMVWHIWWLSIVALFCVILTVIIRSTSDDTEYVIPAAEVRETELANIRRKKLA